MKKQLTVILLSALLLSGCASGRMGNPSAIAAGASIGGSLGNAVGGIIGENNRGWRGGYRGSAIGTIVGTIAGAAVGSALTAPKEQKTDVYIPRTPREDVYMESPSSSSKRPVVQKAAATLRLRKIRFIDDSRNQVIDAGENSKVVFEIMNEGREPVYNVVPIVEQVSKMKHINISPSVMIEEILPNDGIRYTATISAGERLKEGTAVFRIAVADGNGTICDAQEFTIPTQELRRD